MWNADAVLLPSTLRARIALAALFGVFLIPLTTSSLRGLTHVLTCSEAVDATLVIDTTTSDDPVLGSADVVTVDEPVGLCGGLDVDLQLASPPGADEAEVEVTVTNGTDTDWQGSIELEFSGVEVPVAIGAIDAGGTATDTVTLAVEPDRSYEISGTLLIGP